MNLLADLCLKKITLLSYLFWLTLNLSRAICSLVILVSSSQNYAQRTRSSEPSNFTRELQQSSILSEILDSINPFFSIKFLHLVRFQSLSFHKAQNNLQVNAPVVKGTFILNYFVAVELRDRTKLFPPGGCRETTT